MDIFGIGTRIMNSAAEQSRLARGTGRSYVLSDMVMDGDVIVFVNYEHVKEFDRIQRERGKTARYTSVTHDPAQPLSTLLPALGGRPINRLFYDHFWLEAYYREAIVHDMNQIVNLSKRVSREDL